MIISKTARLLAIDPSLNSSGWVMFNIAKASPLSIGIIPSKNTSSKRKTKLSNLTLAERLYFIQKEVEESLEELKLGPNDILVCEGPAPLVLNPQTALKLEHVRGIYETLARHRGACVPGRLNPKTVQTEILNLKGKQLARPIIKDLITQTAKHIFASDLERLILKNPDILIKRRSGKTEIPQDIYDALLIGAVAVSKLQLCQKTQTDIFSIFSEKQFFNRRQYL